MTVEEIMKEYKNLEAEFEEREKRLEELERSEDRVRSTSQEIHVAIDWARIIDEVRVR